MELHAIFIGLGLIVFLGFIGELFFSKTGIPDVLWLILVGILIRFLNLVDISSINDAAPIFTTFALIFILFEGALHIRIIDLLKSMWPSTLITVLTFLLSIGAMMIYAYFNGWPLLNGALLGAILGGTSSAVVLPLVAKLDMKDNSKLILTLESAFSDVLVIIVGITLIEIITIGGFDVGVALNGLVGAFSIAIVVGAIVGILWIEAMKALPKLSENYTLTVAAILVLFGVVEFFNASGAIACLAFGLVLGNSKKLMSITDKNASSSLTSGARFFYSQISFFVKTFFFVYLGLLMDFSNLTVIITAFVITLIFLLIRPLTVIIVSFSTALTQKDKGVMDVLVPKGLAAAVIAQAPLQAGIPGAAEILAIIPFVIFFSILMGTILVTLVEKGLYPGTGFFYEKILPPLKAGQKKSSINADEDKTKKKK